MKTDYTREQIDKAAHESGLLSRQHSSTANIGTSSDGKSLHSFEDIIRKFLKELAKVAEK